MKTKTKKKFVKFLRERTFKDLNPDIYMYKDYTTLYLEAVLRTANLASTYNSVSTHEFDLGDCILAKMNLLKPGLRVRKNPYV